VAAAPRESGRDEERKGPKNGDGKHESREDIKKEEEKERERTKGAEENRVRMAGTKEAPPRETMPTKKEEIVEEEEEYDETEEEEEEEEEADSDESNDKTVKLSADTKRKPDVELAGTMPTPPHNRMTEAKTAATNEKPFINKKPEALETAKAGTIEQPLLGNKMAEGQEAKKAGTKGRPPAMIAESAIAEEAAARDLLKEKRKQLR
jgi:hypothetical protein